MATPPSPQPVPQSGPQPGPPPGPQGSVPPPPFTSALLGPPPFTTPHGPAWLRSPVALGRATATLLGLVIATDLFALWADRTMSDVTGSLAAGGFGDRLQERAADADSLYLVAGVAQTIALVATVVVFLVWFLRVRVNAEVFNPFGHAKSRAWAGWGWFVPFANLWLPRRIMSDIWTASSPKGPRDSQALVNLWWTFWLLGLIVGRVGFSEYRKAVTAQEIHDAVGTVMLSDGLDVVAAGLAILVVLKLTGMQDRKARGGPVPAGL
ncbi:DUF4328 domain-containing protein [Streptomyces sp. NPDC002580]|uniref:DUF4328 domain-containing protein n=1 Tax=Streptomyces sp. NPDC002580 TaxID=3364653 RepID=UPI0036CC1AF3